MRASAGGAAQDKALDTATFTYDFRETSSGTHRSVVKKVSKRDFDKAGQTLDYSGAPWPGLATGGAALLGGGGRRLPGAARLMGPGARGAGAFICVKAYGTANLTFSLRAVPSMCPADFTPAGAQLLCSSPVGGGGPQRHSGCSAEGVCQCVAPYAKPVRAARAVLGYGH